MPVATLSSARASRWNPMMSYLFADLQPTPRRLSRESAHRSSIHRAAITDTRALPDDFQTSGESLSGMTSLESTPQIIERPSQPYVAVREAVAMTTLSRVADHIPELFGWLARRGRTPSGAPFFRYLTIDMERELEVEAGVPVAAPLDLAAEAGGAVTAETLPGGRFVRAFFVGHPDGLENATAELLQWAETQGLRWDMSNSPVGERWGCRLEIYHTDPVEEPHMNAWRTELAFRLADGTTQS
jgi:effector-binding domain-containing protein